MGIGMGALIAGLFGMNVSPVLLPSPFVARRTPAFFLRILPFSLQAIWRDIRSPSWECLPWLPRSHFSSHGLVFEGLPLSILTRPNLHSLLIRTFSRLAKIQNVGLSASSGRRSVGGLPLPLRERRLERRP
jgi:hypothetical protein